MATTNPRAELRDLLDGLADEDVLAAVQYVRYLMSDHPDPLLWTLETAPLEDEPVSEEEGDGVDEAWTEYRAGSTVSAEDARRQLLP